MITISLTPDQLRALQNGAVSREDALSIRGAINSALRETRAGGPKTTCECGTCPKCKFREYRRAKRAGKPTSALADR